MKPNEHKPVLPVTRLHLGPAADATADQSVRYTHSPMGRAKSDGDSLRFERRRADRHGVTGRVTSLQYSGPTGPDQHRKIASLQMVNISDTGACVLTQDPVELDAAMTIFFPPHGADRGFDAVGHVVRCLKRDDNHHELGIRFDFKPAA